MSGMTMNDGFAAGLRAELVAATRAVPVQRKAPRRIALATLATASLAGASLLMPGAYADWTPLPTELSAAESEAIGADCVGYLQEGTQIEGNLGAVLAERRGSWDLSVVIGDDGSYGHCLLSERGGGGGVSPDGIGEAPAADSLTVLGEGSQALDTSLWESGPKAEGHQLLYGRAGQLTSLVLHTERSGDVTATVADGWWAAWWPISNIGPNLTYDDTPVVGATLTTADGRTRELDQAGWEALRQH